jgi:hypothetical protein
VRQRLGDRAALDELLKRVLWQRKRGSCNDHA